MLSVSTQLAPEDDLKVFERMLDSVAFADSLRVYNFGRSDQSFREIVSRHHGEIVELDKPYPKIVEPIRAHEVRESPGDWVLVMDYDEIITPSLASEIKKVSNESSDIGAYKICRKNFSLGFPVSHGGFGDDWIYRLFQKKLFRDWPVNIHSTPVFDGEVRELTGYMEHHKDASLSQMVEKTNRYSEIEARQFFEGSLPPVTVVTLIRKPAMEFIRRYILKKGFLDGRIGLIQSLYQSYSVFISYAKLYELQQAKSRKT